MSEEILEVCKYYNTKKGCKNKDCKYVHTKGESKFKNKLVVISIN